MPEFRGDGSPPTTPFGFTNKAYVDTFRVSGRRRHSTGTQGAPDGAVTALTLTGSTFGTGANLADATNGVQVTKAGLCIVTWEVYFADGNSGARTAILVQDGSTIREGGTNASNARVSGAATVLITTVPTTFTLSVYVTGGSTVTVGSGNVKDVGISVTHLPTG